jgi:hypothetical protein
LPDQFSDSQSRRVMPVADRSNDKGPGRSRSPCPPPKIFPPIRPAKTELATSMKY